MDFMKHWTQLYEEWPLILEHSNVQALFIKTKRNQSNRSNRLQNYGFGVYANPACVGLPQKQPASRWMRKREAIPESKVAQAELHLFHSF